MDSQIDRHLDLVQFAADRGDRDSADDLLRQLQHKIFRDDWVLSEAQWDREMRLRAGLAIGHLLEPLAKQKKEKESL